ncbi:SNF2 family N-terminal domain-containing protein [Mycena sp. CBHHK59/15]|nr:SNF2 family N-terminal domain-containing protein [Mycena sp. CBHHK59/15]
MSSEDLVSLAKIHLSLPASTSSALVPKAYLEELKTHLQLYPNDTRFRVTLQPRHGLGTVTCLENGCGSISIPLIKRVKMSDGGKREGLGSLSAYRTHIRDHATHERNRTFRVERQARATDAFSVGLYLDQESSRLPHYPVLQTPLPLRVSVKKESSILDALNASSSFSTPRAPPSGTLRLSIGSSSSIPSVPDHLKVVPAKRSSLIRLPARSEVKPEPADSIIPPFGSSSKVEDDVVLKKLKQEVLKIPLSQVNHDTAVVKNETLPVPQTPVDVGEVREQIKATQSKISHYQELYDRVQRKKRKSKTDLTRMRQHASELNRLQKLKDEYDASLPRAASPLRRTSSKVITKTESLPKLPMFYNPGLGSKAKAEPSSYLPPAFPRPFGDTKPVIERINAVASGSKGPVPMYVRHAIPDIAPLGGVDHQDANGDYYGRGRDTFHGPQAKADDIDKFLIEAGNAEQFDGNVSVDKAVEKLGLQTKYDLLPSLDIALMPHQLLGVAWMIENERKKSLKGGCVADEMGLGKTVQMIAAMCKNPSENPLCKTTLICAPLALLSQWALEIQTKTNANWKVLIYHGINKPKKKADLLQYDVVLTTYSTMALEWPDVEAEMKKKTNAKRKKANDFIASDSDSDSSDHRPINKRKKDHTFYRIVLDEAQNIRNKRTRVSRAVTELSAIYRWCLTATPIINGLLDVYGYIRFLRVRPWYDWSEFHGHVGKLEKKQPQLAVTRLQAILGMFLIRRMKTTMLDGKRLIELPEKTVELVTLQFSQEERDIYNMVEAAQQAKFNRYLRAGTVLKNYASVLVLLLRLRQLCSHPSLIQENGVSFLAPDEVDDPEEHHDELSRARAVMSPEFVRKMREKFKEIALKRIQAEKESPDAVADEEDCPICFDALTSAVVTPCGHQFCKDCLNDVLETPLPDQNGNGEPNKYKAHERPCPACRSPICSEKLFLSAAFAPTDKDLEENADTDIEMLDAEPVTKGKTKAKAKEARSARRRSARQFVVLDSEDTRASDADTESEDEDEDDDMSDFIVESDEDEEEKDARRILKKRVGKRRAIIVDSDDEIDTPEEHEVLLGAPKKNLSKEAIKLMPRFLPSTKMKAMMETLKNLVEERPDEKTLIVSQWTGCLTLVSDYLSEAGIIHVKYQGDMNRNKREQAVQVFMSKDKARVMLMSLKCGGVGLNLTRANNRLLIQDSVEDRILALQERKQNLADGSLGEGNGKKIGRLSVRELANLFGLDARGRVLAKD